MPWLIRAEPIMEDPIKADFFGRRRPRIVERDDVILFRGAGENLVFWARGRISSVSSEGLGEELIRTSVGIGEIFVYDDGRPLEWFRFSLEKVYRYYRPGVHFRRPYLRLSTGDFDAIDSDNPSTMPTVVGVLLRDLRRSEVLDLLRNIIDESLQVTLPLLLTEIERQLRIQHGDPLELLSAGMETARGLFGSDAASRMSYDQEDERHSISLEDLQIHLQAVVDAVSGPGTSEGAEVDLSRLSPFEIARQDEQDHHTSSGHWTGDGAWRLIVERLSSGD